MAKFISVPREIDAWQFGRSSDGVCRNGCDGETRSHVHTIHDGQIIVLKLGDWIVPEPDGEYFYAIKPDYFAKNYKPLREEGKEK